MAATPISGSSVDRDTLVSYLDDYLAAQDGTDYCPNGLQVEGCKEIGKLVTGVSACEELFRLSADSGAQAVLVHHGLFWRGDTRTLTGVQYRRVAALMQADINLFAYHLPLDRHLEVGNNAVAARQLGLENLRPFCSMDGLPIGVSGDFPRPSTPLETVLIQLTELYGQQPLTFPFGSNEVSNLAVVSGGGGRCLQQAIARGIDLFVTGEAEEWTMNLAKEARINVVAAGHYATERPGVQALGKHIGDRFGIDVEFIDIPNPV